MATFGSWQYTCDRQATADAYSRASCGSSSRCACDGCRNFVAARGEVFPKEFLSLLDVLGVDPTKDGEVYRNGQLSPGKHHYGGWFHFVGTLDVTGDFPSMRFGDDFSAWLCHDSAPSLAELDGLPLVQLEFAGSAVPWVLDEPEPG
ncbi:MAG: hypothetical protein JWL65_3763 [Gammaproteobacteria bacterium]|nr:hypothetical protein [Gammaproteobacteria bacterium]